MIPRKQFKSSFQEWREVNEENPGGVGAGFDVFHEDIIFVTESAASWWVFYFNSDNPRTGCGVGRVDRLRSDMIFDRVVAWARTLACEDKLVEITPPKVGWLEFY